MTNDLEHPTITFLRQNGVPVPTYVDSDVTYCTACGHQIEGQVYEDADHTALCLECLKILHERN